MCQLGGLGQTAVNGGLIVLANRKDEKVFWIGASAVKLGSIFTDFNTPKTSVRFFEVVCHFTGRQVKAPSRIVEVRSCKPSLVFRQSCAPKAESWRNG